MKSKDAYKEVLEFMTSKIYGDNDESCFNKISLNEKNNKGIGNTPMIKINYRYNNKEKSVFAKLEYYNLTGSIKDRVAFYIINNAIERGNLKDGMPIIEATSGNTGISLSALGARYKHPVYIFMPDWASAERVKLMQGYGANVILISKEEGGFIQCMKEAKKMADEIVEPFQDITNTINSTNISEDVLTFNTYNYPELYKITNALTNMSKENKKYLERLEKEKKVRQEFFSNASHELKTPLTSIRGYTELIRSHTIQDSNQIDTCLDCVLKESDHMTQLINDILTISKLETEEMQVTYSHIQVKKLLDSIIETLRVQIEKMDLKVYVNATKFTVFASMDHIKGIFYNVISNAIKYNKVNGRIDIVLKKNQNNMYFSVEDTGIGIPNKDQNRIFQRFYRVDKQRSKTIPGTGLGLSIVKHVVYYYKGDIHLTSKEDVGTKITIELPIVVKEAPES